MGKIVRCNVGIDIAKDDFKTVIWAVIDNNQTFDFGHQTFCNSTKGFKSLISWCKKVWLFYEKLLVKFDIFGIKS